jgi:cyclopropane-fatty-acyl-phospholipid synthase
MSAQTRLASLKTLLAHVLAKTKLDIGFVLWDGSTVPADLAPGALAIQIADEGAVAAILRRPKLDTILNLWVAKRIDIRNGTAFDIAGLGGRVRGRDLRKAIDKRLAFATLLKFLFVPRGGPWPLETIGEVRPSDGSEGENKTNIQYHYDVSNAFYALFLDPEMVYSCAYFTDWGNDIAQAQRHKLEMICRKLRLKPGERFLDIGCGWGALVCHAAQHHGVNAHGVTLSQTQFDLAQDKVKRLGLQDRVTLELRDYRTLEGRFDKIASIGMFEHVGIDNHAAYFKSVKQLLAPDGLYLHHAIARPAKRNDKVFRKNKRAEYVAITRYIFPGGELDHIGMSAANLERHGFEVHDVEAWREHYARTCRLWHDRLLANHDKAVQEIGEHKTRLWLIYLAGCSLGFERGTVGIFQTLASRRKRGPSGLPPTRADLYRS